MIECVNCGAEFDDGRVCWTCGHAQHTGEADD
jgi:rRNA maturation endonuclease Nob1